MKWFFKKVDQIKVDIHSHLIPGIDDGAPTLDHSISMIKSMQKVGFEKLITTPHIHPKFPNSEKSIKKNLESLKKNLLENEIKIKIEAGAEYFVDHEFIDKINSKEPLLSFGDRFVLIECSFTVKPFFFESVIYKLKEAGYRPVLAHPERYRFLEGDIDWLKEIKMTGVMFQVTLGSIGGYYGTTAKKLGHELIKEGMVDFLGSDLHRSSQIEFLMKGLNTKAVKNLVKRGSLLNDKLA